MNYLRSFARTSLMLAAVATVALAGPTDLRGQLAVSRSSVRVLVLPPIPGSGTDTAFAWELGNEIRDRMASKFRFKLQVIPSETICEALQASGFDCPSVLPAENGSALARFLQAQGYVIPWVTRTSDSVEITLRLVDAAGSGLGGWQTMTRAAGESTRDLARDVADALDDPVKAAEQARECDQRRGRSDFNGARDRARRAFDLQANQPAAAMCLALVFEVERQPADSLIAALERAVRGDSLNGDAWEMLGRRYLDAGDTTKGVDAFEEQLRSEPNNIQLRHGVAIARMQQGEYQRAVDLLQYALNRNPLDVPTLQLKARACVEGELWGCALSALSAQYEVDSTLVGDTVFYARVFGAAQSQEDTAAMLRWSEEAVGRVPGVVSVWRARVAALKAVGRREEAVAAYDHILGLDSSQTGSALAAAQYLLDSTLVIDTVMPLDTVRLMKADSMLQLVSSRTEPSDTATMMSIAALYYNPGTKIAQARIMHALPIAAHYLEQTIAHDVRGQLTQPANFFLGLAYFFQIPDLDTRVRETQDCALVDLEIELIEGAKRAMTIGAPVSQQTADRILEFVSRYEAAVPTYKPAFGC